MEQADLFGKKVFFLYPHSVIQDELIDTLLAQEYEVYFLKDHQMALRLFVKYPNSVCYINIDEGLSEKEWERYILGIHEKPETASTLVGVLSYSKDPELAQKYLMEIQIPCGFVHLKQGVREAAAIISKVLDANEVRGRRKYVRAKCEDDALSQLNLRYANTMYTGNIIDISSVGMACSFDQEVSIPQKVILPDIQLMRRGLVGKVQGIVSGAANGGKRYVILFHPSTEHEAKEKIRRYIHLKLQQDIERDGNGSR